MLLSLCVVCDVWSDWQIHVSLVLLAWPGLAWRREMGDGRWEGRRGVKDAGWCAAVRCKML